MCRHHRVDFQVLETVNRRLNLLGLFSHHVKASEQQTNRILLSLHLRGLDQFDNARVRTTDEHHQALRRFDCQRLLRREAVNDARNRCPGRLQTAL